MYCANCGAEINDNAVICVKCGCSVVHRPRTTATSDVDRSSRDWLTTLLLSILVGYLGIHRFYAGKIGTAILQLITGGGCGFWQLYDIIIIDTGKFTDDEGKVIKDR